MQMKFSNENPTTTKITNREEAATTITALNQNNFQ